MAEAVERIFQYVKQENRPFSVQNVVDMMAQHGIKKTACQKALDELAEKGQITCKEFGKTKIYLALQDSSQALSKEDYEKKQANVRELVEQVKQEAEQVNALKKELQGINSALTVAEVEARLNDVTGQCEEAETKLGVLRSGAVLVTKEQREAVEKAFQSAMNAWGKNKKMFKNIWDQLSENLDQNKQELFEEIGIEAQEPADCDYATLSQLLPKRMRR